MAASNHVRFEDLLNADGLLTDLGRDAGASFAQMGDATGAAHVAKELAADADRRSIRMVGDAAHAYDDMGAVHGISIDPDMWISSIAFSDFKPEKGDAAGILFQQRLAQYDNVLQRVVVDPAVRAWKARKDAKGAEVMVDALGNAMVNSEGALIMTKPFSETLALGELPEDGLSVNEKAAYASALQMLNNTRSLFRKVAGLAPCLDAIDTRLSEADSTLKGTAGLHVICVKIRAHIVARVRTGRAFCTSDVLEALAVETTKEASATPMRDKAGKLSGAIRTNVDALMALIVSMRGVAGVDSASQADIDTLSSLVAVFDELGFKPRKDRGKGADAFPWADVFQNGERETSSGAPVPTQDTGEDETGADTGEDEDTSGEAPSTPSEPVPAKTARKPRKPVSAPLLTGNDTDLMI